MRSYTRYTQTQENNNDDNNNNRKKERKRKIQATVQLTTQTTRPTQYIKQQLVSVRQNKTNESSPDEQIITLTESSPYQHHPY